MKLKTCAKCPEIFYETLLHGVVAKCKLTQRIVPQHSHNVAGQQSSIAFWQVPMSCPRSDDEVEKNPKRIPFEEWEII